QPAELAHGAAILLLLAEHGVVPVAEGRMRLETGEAGEDLALVEEARPAPLQRLLAIGAGFVDHAAQMGEDRPGEIGLACDIGFDAGVGLHGGCSSLPGSLRHRRLMATSRRTGRLRSVT